ncbi:MAG TPA: ABC transporter permease [Chloroflexota bacterium]|nr:ABC transporter permease [Chloroflexota bacterium]
MTGLAGQISRAARPRRNGWVVGTFAVLALMLVYERVIHSTAFGAYDMQSLVDPSVSLALAAMAQAAVVLAGGIDLSVGAMMSLSNVIAANWMVNAGFGDSLAMSAVLLLGGALAGAATGLVITYSRVPDIIVTLATGAIWGGLALQVMPTPGGGVPQDFANLLTGDVRGSGFPVGFVVLALALILVWFPLRFSRPGLAMYALGSNRTAAYLSGVNVGRTRVIAYAVGGVFAVLGGLTLTAQTLNGTASSGATFTLQSVAAIVIGGVALTGGRGGMLGPIAAAFILTLLGTLLGYLNVDPSWGLVIQGVVMVGAVMVGGLLLRRRK